VAIVCSCVGTTERSVLRAIDDGARSICQVSERCGAGANCGGCHGTIEDLLCDADRRGRRLTMSGATR
jgi:bacterioferritin-associated ferredoxin